MREEASNTERFHRAWGTPLRRKAINFVAAGTLAPYVLLQPTAPDLEETQSPAPAPSPSPPPLPPPREGQDETVLLAGRSQGSGATSASINLDRLNFAPEEKSPPKIMDEVEHPESARFPLDCPGDADVGIDPALRALTIRAPSPCPSNSSSSEEIVFVPRSRRGQGAPNSTASRQPAAGTGNHPHPVITPALSASTATTSIATATTSTATATTSTATATTSTAIATTSTATATTSTAVTTHIGPAPTATAVAEPTGFIGLNSQSLFNGKRATAGNKRRKAKRRHSLAKMEDREAAEECIEAVAAQMRAEAAEGGGLGGTSSMGCFNAFRELGGSTCRPDDDSSTDPDEARSDSDAVKRYRDGRDASTDAEQQPRPITRLLGKRVRRGTPQYLVRWDGCESDDAIWTPASRLHSSPAHAAYVKQYEDGLLDSHQAPTSSAGGLGNRPEGLGGGDDDDYGGDGDDDGESGGDSDGDGDDDEEEEEEEEEDAGDGGGDNDDNEEEEEENKDLELAKFLQRQEELSLPVDDDLGEIMDLDDNFFPMGVRKQGNRRKSHQGMPDMAIGADPLTGEFPSASAMAEAYDGFDIMDWDRPNKGAGKGKGKGKARLAALNLDPELEAKLTASWERDRQAKKLRKIEREARRVEAQKTDKVILGSKYKRGMTAAQIDAEIREFLPLQEHARYSAPHPHYTPVRESPR